MSVELIDQLFGLHELNEAQSDFVEHIMDAGRDFALLLDQLLPGCPEKEIAIRKLSEVCIYGSLAVSMHPELEVVSRDEDAPEDMGSSITLKFDTIDDLMKSLHPSARAERKGLFSDDLD